ncbi:hypothetical protein [Methanoregula sp.]|uniref:hypothetical protein n=1 Tax=Methanoregula sp. TaxID=2052170 RepID=UPI002621DC96|nr:hypothetical protein [Methanoregula sp.]MDD5143703.1 hypothetical protein [Methanoregula sp.]
MEFEQHKENPRKYQTWWDTAVCVHIVRNLPGYRTRINDTLVGMPVPYRQRKELGSAG